MYNPTRTEFFLLELKKRYIRVTRCQAHYVFSVASTSRQRALCCQLRGLRSWVLRTRLRGHATTQEGRAFEEACGCKGAKVAKEENQVTAVRSLLSVFCSVLRHFIHMTDNFCHLFCPFSQVVPWSSPAAPDFLSPLSSHLHLPPLCSVFCSVLSLLSSFLSSLFPLPVSRSGPLVYPPCSV